MHLTQVALDYFLGEYTFRFNRGTLGSRGPLFLRLIQQAVDLSPVLAKELLGGRRGARRGSMERCSS
jgi:hypothetical protein